MKIYAVYATVELFNQPRWLQDFRSKYDDPYTPHITLKQPARIDDADAETIRHLVGSYMDGRKESGQDISITFDRVLPDISSNKSDLCIMLAANENTSLRTLQKNLVTLLSTYSNYTDPELGQYEHRFRPHLTIGRHLTAEEYAKALTTLPDQHSVVGLIEEIELVVVPKATPAETTKVSNITSYPV